MLKERMDRLLETFIAAGTIGCSCSVVRRGETLYEGCFGTMNRETGRPVDIDTVFRMYSMTKVVTCTAAMMLFDRGLFQLSDPVSKFLPEFAEPTVATVNGFSGVDKVRAARPMRVRDLFSMTTGLPYGNDLSESGRGVQKCFERTHRKVSKGGTVTLREWAGQLAKVPLAFEPGTSWLYGVSHDILAAFVEVVAGKPYEQFLKDELFAPLGMGSTSFRFADIDMDRLCRMYRKTETPDWTDGSGNDIWYESDRFPAFGGAGLLSTLGDYQRFAQMLACGGTLDGRKYIGRNTIDLMRTNQLTPDELKAHGGDRSGFGYGLGVYTAMNRATGGFTTSPGEFGWAGMAGTSVLIDPDEGISLVYMQQQLPNDEGTQKPALRAVLYGALC